MTLHNPLSNRHSGKQNTYTANAAKNESPRLTAVSNASFGDLIYARSVLRSP
ncbi:hypothetical protein HMPREF0454_02327 [Hafnia alvei ATCC 51873]|uniref:Uncharacterized protein n=1 Tax=Hafnia alvei ATCC 51873 TaxID=1002364 RepID=G9Y6V7_HAFAL|nr:hypothetical protein HMPREF0454_02327 [Hafnia alvei ATCC 51873]